MGTIDRLSTTVVFIGLLHTATACTPITVPNADGDDNTAEDHPRGAPLTVDGLGRENWEMSVDALDSDADLYVDLRDFTGFLSHFAVRAP